MIKGKEISENNNFWKYIFEYSLFYIYTETQIKMALFQNLFPNILVNGEFLKIQISCYTVFLSGIRLNSNLHWHWWPILQWSFMMRCWSTDRNTMKPSIDGESRLPRTQYLWYLLAWQQWNDAATIPCYYLMKRDQVDLKEYEVIPSWFDGFDNITRLTFICGQA